nr:phage tail tape measure protein [Bacillus pumilus]
MKKEKPKKQPQKLTDRDLRELMAGFITLLHAGGDKIDKFTKEIENSGGIAEKVAKEQMDNLAGSVEYLRSAVNNAVISLGNQFIPTVRKVVDGLTKVVKAKHAAVKKSQRRGHAKKIKGGLS